MSGAKFFLGEVILMVSLVIDWRKKVLKRLSKKILVHLLEDYFDNSSLKSNFSRLIRGLGTVSVVQIASGDNHGLALTKGSKMYSWGNNEFGQLGLGPNIGAKVSTPQVNYFAQTCVESKLGRPCLYLICEKCFFMSLYIS